MFKAIAMSLLMLLLLVSSLAASKLSKAWMIDINDLVVPSDAVPAKSQVGNITQVSVSSSGEKGNGSSWNPSISEDGRYIAFESDSRNLVSDYCRSLHKNVFIHDQQTHETIWVSRFITGDLFSYCSHGHDPSLSDNGHYVAFTSGSDNLVYSDTNRTTDVFVHSIGSGTTQLVSVASDGTQGNGISAGPALSGNGHFVTFVSSASNLVHDDTNDTNDVFLRDLANELTERISVNSDGTEGNNFSIRHAVSEDGSYVVFLSEATNLVSNDNNGVADVFLRNRTAGTTTRISVNSDGQEANGPSTNVDISKDGRYIVFTSTAWNLVPDDTNASGSDTFMYDRESGLLEIVSLDFDGSPFENGAGGAVISADGRSVVYWGTNSHSQFIGPIINNLETRQIRLVSSNSDGTQASCCSVGRSISGNGRFVAFDSDSSDYGNRLGQSNTFVNDLGDAGFCEIPLFVGSNNGSDSDGDGLLDAWETCGYDVNGDNTIDLDLRTMGADPNRKDIFVEIDYMATTTHSHRPVLGVLEDVIAVFATKGISLHLTIDEAVPELEPVSFSTQPVQVTPAGAFNDLKLGNPVNPCGINASDAHFGSIADRSSPNCINIITARRDVFRYAIFGHNHAHSVGSSGIGELPGNDFLITLGGWSAANIQNVGGQRAAEASTFMHELGHTLGLRHGGADNVNCKPNYLSVMNYSLQFAGADPTRDMDYSGRLLFPLNENGGLNEGAGINGPTGRNVIYGVNGVTVLVPTNGPIDWNGVNGANDTNVSADINWLMNTPGCNNADGFSVLSGYDDWNNLSFNFRTSPDFADGSGRVTPLAEPEITGDDVTKIAKSVDFDKDGHSNADDNCPGVPNPDQTDTDGDEKGDICQLDTDGDGFPDVRDNCPAIYNIIQEDTDGDGVGDACQTQRRDIYLPVISK